MKKMILLILLLIIPVLSFAMSPNECREKYQDYVSVVTKKRNTQGMVVKVEGFHFAKMSQRFYSSKWSDMIIVRRSIDKKPSAAIVSFETAVFVVPVLVLEYGDGCPQIKWKAENLPQSLKAMLDRILAKMTCLEL